MRRGFAMLLVFLFALLTTLGQGALTICHRQDGSHRLLWTKAGCQEHQCCCQEEDQSDEASLEHACHDVLVQAGPLLVSRTPTLVDQDTVLVAIHDQTCLFRPASHVVASLDCYHAPPLLEQFTCLILRC